MSESQQNEVQRARDEAERRKRSTQSASAARIAYQHQWVDEQIRIAHARGDFDDLPGAGKPIDEIISSMNQVAEGVKASSVIMEFADKCGITMPIAREVDGVVNHGSTVEQAYRGLMVEKPGHEVLGSGF